MMSSGKSDNPDCCRALETGRPRKERFADYQKRRQEHHAEMEHVETQDKEPGSRNGTNIDSVKL